MLELTLVVAVFIGIVGLLIGSFLNVLIFRIHSGEQFAKGRSHCQTCKHELSPWELIPVVSWLVLRGKCRSCRKPISPQYPLIEALTSALFVGVYLHVMPSTWQQVVVMIGWLIIAAGFVVLSVYDIRWFLLPDKILLPLIVPALIIAAVGAQATGSWHVLYGPLAAAAIFGGGFFALAAVSGGRWMGGGDIKLAFVMGLLLGMQKTALAMLIAFWAAAIIGLMLIATKRRKRTDHIPFGPFLIAGTLLAYFFGANIIDWYIHVSGLEILTSS